jgi:hypothetical protein
MRYHWLIQIQLLDDPADTQLASRSNQADNPEPNRIT